MAFFKKEKEPQKTYPKFSEDEKFVGKILKHRTDCQTAMIISAFKKVAHGPTYFVFCTINGIVALTEDEIDQEWDIADDTPASPLA